MMDWGMLYVVAASLPLLAGLLLVLFSIYSHPSSGGGQRIGDGRNVKFQWIGLSVLGASVLLSLIGFLSFLSQLLGWIESSLIPWTASFSWLHLTKLGFENSGNLGFSPDAPGVELRFGYYIDSLTSAFFLIISVVAFLVYFSFSRSSADGRPAIGKGLSLLLVGLTLHLILADNLLQILLCSVFLSVCLYFLRGGNSVFSLRYFGDILFLVAIVILWTFTGTMNLVTEREIVRNVRGNVVLEDGQPKTRIARLSIVDALRAPAKDSHDDAFAEAGLMIRVDPVRTRSGKPKWQLNEHGSQAVVWNQVTLDGHFDRPDKGRFDAYDSHGQSGHGLGLRTIPYWVLCLAGLGIVLGCLSKLIRQPIPIDLTRATAVIESPGILIYPLITAATGVYVTARLFPLFTAEVLLFLAYAGAVAAFYGASCACVQTDRKKILSYVIVSQFGLMFAALAVGGWTAALFHLTVFFLTVALIVAIRVDSQQLTSQRLILFSCLSMIGLPFLPGWYSQNGIVAALTSFVSLHPKHSLLLILPLVSIGLVALNLMKLILAKTTSNESGTGASHLWLSVPLALLSLIIVWLPNSLSFHSNWWIGFLAKSEPSAAGEPGFLRLNEVSEQLAAGYFNSSSWLRELHEQTNFGPLGIAVLTSLIFSVIGVVWAWRVSRKCAAEVASLPTSFTQFLLSGWYLNHLVGRLVYKPIKSLSKALNQMDHQFWEGLVLVTSRLVLLLAKLARAIDESIIDGLVSLMVALGRKIGLFAYRLRRARWHST